MTRKLPFDQQYTLDTITQCWNWQGPRISSSNYSMHWEKTRNNYVSARRWSYQHTHGVELPETQRLRSTCHNTFCVNPAHMEIKQHVFKDPAWTQRGARPRSRGLRPQCWKIGTDPVLHKKYLVWLQQRNQAQWREESWSLEFDAWLEIWGDQWDQRGRSTGSLCMTRLNPDQPWSHSNVHIITREQHARQQAEFRARGHRSSAQQRRRAQQGTV